MKDITYENNLNHSYMIMEPECRDDIEHYQLRMIGENKINGLLPCSIRELDGKAKVYYEITSCEELKKRYENKEISFEECRCILTSIQKTLYTMQEYLLDGDHICLDEQYMFWDESNQELKLLFLPKKEICLQESFKHLAEYILEKVDHTDDQAVSVAYHFYKDSRIDHFSMKSVIRSLNEAELKRAKIQTEAYMKKNEQEMEEVFTGEVVESNHKENVLPFRNEKTSVTIQLPQKQVEEKETKKKESKQFNLKEYKNSVLFLGMAVVMTMIYLLAPLGEIAAKGCLFGMILCLVLSYYQYYGGKKKNAGDKIPQEKGSEVVELPHLESPSQRSFTYTKDPYVSEPTTRLDQYEADDLTFEVWNPDKAVM